MKRFIRTYLAVCAALGAVALGGCTKEQPAVSQEGVIRLGVRSATRAVNTLEDLSKVGDRIGIVAVGTTLEEPGRPADGSHWGKTPLMDNVRTTSVDPASGAISWQGVYYYPAQSLEYVEFCAYHPYGASGAADQATWLEPGAAGRAPQLHFTLSGREDVMFATPVFGRYDTAPASLEFRHVLTQLRFQLVDAYGAMGDVSIRAVTLLGVNRSAVLDIENGELSAWSNPGEVPLEDVTEAPITGTPSSPQALGREVMLQPGQESFTLRVETSAETFEQVEIHPTSSIGGVPESAFAAGRSYLITLTFKKQIGIVASATVVPWILAGSGEVIIQ